MPTLEVGIDATGAKRGADDAAKALDQVANKAKSTTQAMTQMGTAAKVGGNNLSAAFAATGGGLSVTRGLVGIGDGFRSANTAMATFAASQALLDLGRFSADMRSVASATGATGGALRTIGAIIKANPLLTLATVLAGVATAMGLFGRETEDAASAFDKLAEAQRKARLSEDTKSFLGISTLSTRGTQLKGIEDLVELLRSDPQKQTLGSISQFTNVPVDRIRSAEIATGGSLGSQYRNVTRTVPIGGNFSNGVRDEVFRERVPDSERTVSPEAARNILRVVYRDLMRSIELQSVNERSGVTGGFSPNPGLNFYQPTTNPQFAENRRIRDFRQAQQQQNALVFGQGALGPNQFEVDFGSPSNGGSLIRQSTEERAQIDANLRQRNIEQAQIEMDRLIQQGEQFGATIGDAFFNVASGAQTARQAIAAIVSDLARATAQRGFAGIFGSVAGSFGKTGAQAAGDSSPGNGSNLTLPD